MASMDERTQDLLLELTGTPTASGREDRVVAFVERWAKRRRNVTLRRDRFGNVVLQRGGGRSASPIIFEAHMDHPAFVVHSADGREVVAAFRGGVQKTYFAGTRVRLHRAD